MCIAAEVQVSSAAVITKQGKNKLTKLLPNKVK